MLAKFFLAFVVTLYVLLFIKKTKSVLWFSLYLVGYSLLDFFAFWGSSYEGIWQSLNFPAQYFASLLLTASYLKFAYYFKEELFKKEHRLVTKLILLICSLGSVYLIYKISTIGFGNYDEIQILLPIPIILLLWSAVVFFRKLRANSKKDERSPLLHSAYLSFFILTVLAIILSMGPALRALDMIDQSLFTLSFFVLNLSIFAVLTASFINFVTEHTTVLVKLVGVSLVLFIAIIGVQGFIFVSEQDSASLPADERLEYRQQLHDELEPYAWFLLGSSVMIIAVFPVFYNKSVLLPLRSLLDGVNQVNRGNLNVTIPILNQDEFGTVTTHFNTMTANLRRANVELKEYAEQLEQRVALRTEEIQEKNNILAEVNTKLEEQKLELERMDSFRTRLFMDISHELRTPITLVSGPIQKIIEKKSLDYKDQKQLQLALRNSQRLQQLVEQIIDLNRLESDQLNLHISKINIKEFLDITIASYRSFVEHNGIIFNYSTIESQVELYVDVDKLQKIINNLISNAVKFTQKNDSISISLTEKEQHISFEITDTGRGIEPERLPTIFNRYQTIAHKEAGYKEGLGVGLAITKEYVDLMEGEIFVESELGKGTTFRVMFKKGSSHIDEAKINPGPPDKQKLSVELTTDTIEKKKNSLQNSENLILLVEDNEDMASYVEGILAGEGYDVIHASHGEKALEELKTTTPVLIISDIMMPVMDGMEFLKQLKNNPVHKGIPTIFLSARSDIEGRLQGFQLGINDYLIKPFNPTELLYRIRNLIEFSATRSKFSVEVSEEPGDSKDDEFVTKLTALVEERLGDPNLTVEELAADTAMSRRTLYREIKRITGMSAARFVKEIRLQKARKKLEAGFIESISELSEEIGFQTGSYLSQVYFKRFGKKPTEYIRK